MTDTVDFNKRAGDIKSIVAAAKGKRLAEYDDKDNAIQYDGRKVGDKEPVKYSFKDLKAGILNDMENAVKELGSLRTYNVVTKRPGIDLPFSTYVKDKWGFAAENAESTGLDQFYSLIGVVPSQHTIESLYSMPDNPAGYTWIIPEIIREAVVLGLRKAPIYPNLIAAEQSVAQPLIQMPTVNFSAGEIRRIGEAETIPTGTVSFGNKNVAMHLIGTGMKYTDEVLLYTSIDILRLYLQDIGVKIAIGTDSLAIQTLLNGDQLNGSEAIPVIGTENVGTISYKDILRAGIRMGRLGRNPTAMLSNETTALNVLLLDEFKGIYAGTQTLGNITLKTPVPRNYDYFIHGSMPAANMLMLLDKQSALIKLNLQGLKLETERIAEKRISGTYATLSTGFATLFQDARLLLDSTQSFASKGFPDYMNVDAWEASLVI